MIKTNKEKKFSATDAEKLFTVKNNKSVSTKEYNILTALAKDSLKHDETLYVYNTKKHGKLDVYISESSPTTFNEKAFAEAHPKLYKKFLTPGKRVTLSIKKQK